MNELEDKAEIFSHEFIIDMFDNLMIKYGFEWSTGPIEYIQQTLEFEYEYSVPISLLKKLLLA